MPPIPQTWDAQLVSVDKQALKVVVVLDILRFGTVVNRVTFTADDTAPRPPNAIAYQLDVSPPV